VSGDFVSDPAVSDEIRYEAETTGNVTDDRLRALVDQVDEIAEIQTRCGGGRACVWPERK